MALDLREKALRETIQRCKNYRPEQLCIRYEYKKDFAQLFERKGTFDTTVTVMKLDTLEAARRYDNALVLIMADSETPGGCYKALSGQQEESLFYRSGLIRHLLPQHYPIAPTECLVAPNVPVWFGPESTAYAEKVPHETYSFIACPGLKNPQMVNGQMTSDDYELLKIKIDLILLVAHRRHHSNVILSALGCGVFYNSPRQVARAFKDVIVEWKGVFDNIVFAILGGNYNIFDEIFQR